MKLGIYGAGGQGRGIIDACRAFPESFDYDEILFIDDVIGVKEFYNARVFTFEEVVEKFDPNEIKIAIALGDPSLRKIVYERVKSKNYSLATIITPNSKISPSVKLGEGVIMDDVRIYADTQIGDNTMFCDGVILGHDNIIGKHNLIGCSSIIAGHVESGECVYFGPSSTLRDGLRIGDNAVAGIGAVVFNDIPQDMVAIGNPARILPQNKSGNLFSKH